MTAAASSGSGFRPSDDACDLGYLIPSNMFASVVLGYLSEIAREVLHDEELAKEAAAFSKEVHDAIEANAVASLQGFGRVTLTRPMALASAVSWMMPMCRAFSPRPILAMREIRR